MHVTRLQAAKPYFGFLVVFQHAALQINSDHNSAQFPPDVQ